MGPLLLVQTFAYLKSLLQVLVGNVPPVTVAMTVANASPNATAVGALSGVAIGDTISGTDVPPGTTVVAMDDAAHTLTMSANATGAHTGNYVFSYPTTGAPFNGGMKVRLFANNHVPDPTDVIGDYTEATFDGYAASSAVVWSSVGVDDAGNPLSIGDQKLFQMTGNTTPNTVYGYYITDTGGTTLYWAELFPTPKTFTQSGDQVAVVPTYGMSNQP